MTDLRGTTKTRGAEFQYILDATEQMSQATSEVAMMAQESAQTAKGAIDASADGQRAAERASAAMEEAARYVADSEERIRGFSEKMEAIDSTVTAIKSIADQTNLLALNAAIEAARAGSAGLGFAVVADEVRNLAERSRQSATQITSMISDIRDDARSLVEIVGAILERTAEGDALIQDTVNSFANIVAKVTSNGERFERIAAAIEEQSAMASTIASTVNSLK
ncbi:MAG: methyl-accepting chemotaxis protein [Actinomycetota bacterium]|jgi:methyl-accepting chemotaxis protein|nr:methyl-accepting chemotaxis protein [Actinomycetota bacterium]